MLSEEPAQCQFMCHKFHVTNPGIESGTPTERTAMSYSFSLYFNFVSSRYFSWVKGL
jgi:hypothetical protein